MRTFKQMLDDGLGNFFAAVITMGVFFSVFGVLVGIGVLHIK